jgi:hypothetical protein
VVGQKYFGGWSGKVGRRLVKGWWKVGGRLVEGWLKVAGTLLKGLFRKLVEDYWKLFFYVGGM